MNNNISGDEQESVVAEIEKNRRETVRVSLSQYRGRAVFSVRTWYLDEQGAMRPSPKGITLQVSHLAAVVEGLSKALDQARGTGLA